MHRVALIGLGIMGSGLAGNLLKAGFPLTIYNRTPEKAAPFIAQGARIAATPRAAVHDADVILSVVGDDTASRAIWLGDEGALAGAKAGAVIVECSTLSLPWVMELAAMATEKQLSFLDAPMAGSREAAANAQIGLFVGGAADDLESARPVLESVSRRQVHLGATGAGTKWKLINNMMLAVHVAAAAEGLALAERAGLDMEQVVALILNGGTASMIVQGKLPRMTEKRYDHTDFALRWMQKDTGYAMELAESLGLPIKTVEAAYEMYGWAREKGLDDADFAAVVEALRK